MNPHTRTQFQAGRRLGILMLPMILMLCSTSFGQTLMGGMAKQKPIDFSDRVVTFNTPDGVTIVADYYPVKVSSGKKTPIAILIHMYPADRSSWKPFVPNLREAGIAVLAYDIRGTGASTKPANLKLEEGYKSHDTAHFQQAFMDVAGATAWLSKQKNINLNRLVCIGASIGCSITLDFTMRTDEPKAVVCLSPGTNYFGVDSKEHIKNCSSTPILLISPEAEYGAVKELVEASGGKAKSKKYPGGREYHGTGMFDADYGEKVKKKIMRFVKKHLGIKDKKKNDDSDKSKKKKKRKKKHKKKTGA